MKRWLVPYLSAAISACSFSTELPDASDSDASTDVSDGASAIVDSGLEPDPLVIEVGTGQDMFEPLQNGDTIELEYGIQGGFHLWAALRVHDSTLGGITVTAELLDRQGTIFRQRHLRQIQSLPADVLGMRVLVEPTMVDTASVSLLIDAFDERGRRGRDRRVIMLEVNR